MHRLHQVRQQSKILNYKLIIINSLTVLLLVDQRQGIEETIKSTNGEESKNALEDQNTPENIIAASADNNFSPPATNQTDLSQPISVSTTPASANTNQQLELKDKTKLANFVFNKVIKPPSSQVVF